MECCTKVSLFIVNFVVFCLGIAVVAVASALLGNGADFDFFLDDNTFSLPMFALVIGIFIMIVGFLGCWGAIKEKKCMLYMYAVILLILLIAELVVGIMILVNADMEEKIAQTFRKYANDSSELQENIDELQRVFECCGVIDYKDWADYPYGQKYNNSVPDGCCKDDDYEMGCGFNVLSNPDFENLIFTSGCIEVVNGIVEAFAIALGVLCIIFAIIQAVSIGCACGLAQTVRY